MGNKTNRKSIIGARVPLIDARDKVTGRARYTDDLRLPNPLTIKILRSPHASARIVGIDIKAAQSMPGVVAILVGTDFRKRFGVLPISKDEPPLAVDTVRYVGEPVVAVAAETERDALTAIGLIDVTYEVLESVQNPESALQTSAAPIHPELKNNTNIHKTVEQNFGDVEKGLAEADVVTKGRFTFDSVTHAFTEPHATQVEVDTVGNLTVYSATQVPHYLHKALTEVLEIPMDRIRVVKPVLGGGFGGKSDPFPHEMIAARFALDTGRNTRIRFEREEVFFSHHGRHPTEIEMTVGLSRKNGVAAIDGRMLIDGGAYASFGVVTTYYNGVLLQGPYRLPNFRFHCDRVYTNKPMCGAMRGHGGVNPRFAAEVLIDEACSAAGIDPAAARADWFLRENSLTANEFRVTSVGIHDGFKAVLEKSRWHEKYGKLPYGKGIGVACGFFISGSALPIHWTEMPHSTVRLTIDYDGGAVVYSGASDIGQGSDTMLAQMVAGVLGMPMSRIRVVSADTRLTPIDYGSYSSRVTFMAGNAARNAAISMRRILVDAAAAILKVEPPARPPELVEKNFFRQGQRTPEWDKHFLGPNPLHDQDGYGFSADGITAPDGRTVGWIDAVRRAMDFRGVLQTQGCYQSPKMGGTFKGAGAGLSPSYSFTTFVTEVTVDPETGFIKVDRVTANHDCGTEINPMVVEGQIEGSIHMGLGQALMEGMNYKKGVLQNASFLDYKIPSPFEQPEIDIVRTGRNYDNEGPFGAKEVGEGSLAPLSPSIANAVYDAVGIRLRSLPMTPDRVLKALAAKTAASASSDQSKQV